jgi:hypothetical protein
MKKKLLLSRETVTTLTSDDLATANGAGTSIALSRDPGRFPTRSNPTTTSWNLPKL